MKIPVLISCMLTHSGIITQMDLIAGISVGFMVVPQGLAYASSAGVTSVFGLYGAFLPCLVYALCMCECVTQPNFRPKYLHLSMYIFQSLDVLPYIPISPLPPSLHQWEHPVSSRSDR